MKDKKTAKTFMFDKEVIEHSEKNILISSFPEVCCDLYREKYMKLESITQELELLKIKEKYLIDKMKQIKLIKPQEVFKKEEILWWREEGLERIQYGKEFDAVFRFFCDKFDRHDIFPRQARLLIDKLKKEKEDEILNVVKRR